MTAAERSCGVPYDGTDPANRDLYLDNSRYLQDVDVPDPWYCDDAEWHRHWLESVTEIIDRYQPDLLYSDGPLPFGEVDYTPGLRAVSHLYNTSARIHGSNRAVYQQKDHAAIGQRGWCDGHRTEPDP